MTVRLPMGVLSAVIHLEPVAIIRAFRSMLLAIHGARVTVIIVVKPCGAKRKPLGKSRAHITLVRTVTLSFMRPNH